MADLVTLRQRLTEYLKAEAMVLKKQEYSIDVDGSSRRYRYADLRTLQDEIKALEAQIERAESTANRTRRVRYLVPR